MIEELDPKFLEFLEIYERVYTMPAGRLKTPYIPALCMDKEAQSLLDDLEFLLTHEARHQEKTREKLRKLMSEIAHERLKPE